MGFFEILKQIFNRVLRKGKESDIKAFPNSYTKLTDSELEMPVAEKFSEDELTSSITDGVLDANSEKAIETLKHNLKVLIRRTKKAGKIEKFMIIREDDVFPSGWQWDVLSSDTSIESVCTPLSYSLRQAYASRAEKGKHGVTTDSIRIPQLREKQLDEVMGNVDKTIGNFLFPPRFRSTKHFTINTPLEVTGNYNFVCTDRDYIIIDSIDEFLKSGYGYSISYHDAYLDTSHEALPISENAVVLIREENYDRIMSDSSKAAELAQRRVIKYKGDTYMAINLMLSEMGVLPSQIGEKYAFYDVITLSIIDKSIRNLASVNGLLFDRSHSGTGTNGHFTSYFDDRNHEYQDAVNESIEFLIKRFPEKEQLLRRYLSDKSVTGEIVEQIGIDELIMSINEYNQMVKTRFKKSLESHIQNRKSIPTSMHKQFASMVSLLNDFYSEVPFDSDFEGKAALESSIQKFFQGHTYQEQIEGLRTVWEYLRPLICKEQLNNNSKKDRILSFKGNSTKTIV